jgi:hypothetical protein
MEDSLNIINNSFTEGLSIEIIGGLVVGVIIIIIGLFLKKGPEKDNNTQQLPLLTGNKESNTIKDIKQNVKVKVNLNEKSEKINKKVDFKSDVKLTYKEQQSRIDLMKNKVNILFIDDDTKFNTVKILKSDGWKNTSSVQDIKGLDIAKVRDANIYFVDINGVGLELNCKYEGLDLAQMLKEKYPDKIVVIYSANNNQHAFHPAWEICDKRLEKDALPNQFEKIIEDYSLLIYKKY